MKERLHQYLDGQLQREELTAEELREVALYETAISEIENISRAFAVPDLTAAVQARIERTDVVPHRSGGVKALLGKTASWLWAPRAVHRVPSTPRLPNGKVDRQAARAAVRGEVRA